MTFSADDLSIEVAVQVAQVPHKVVLIPKCDHVHYITGCGQTLSTTALSASSILCFVLV